MEAYFRILGLQAKVLIKPKLYLAAAQIVTFLFRREGASF